jgi:nicotinamide-nucleotide amidase
MFSETIRGQASRLIDALRARGEMIVTAESCTGGLIAAALTDIAGSSDAVFGGYVTYDNRAKIELIEVNAELIGRCGAVSEPVAVAMAEGARATAGAEVSVAVTGIAGPGGGSDEKPIGLVYLACTTARGTTVIERRFGDIGRQQVREATVEAALDLVLECVGG